MGGFSSGSGTEDDQVAVHGAIEGRHMAYSRKPWDAVNGRIGSGTEICCVFGTSGSKRIAAFELRSHRCLQEKWGNVSECLLMIGESSFGGQTGV